MDETSQQPLALCCTKRFEHFDSGAAQLYIFFGGRLQSFLPD